MIHLFGIRHHGPGSARSLLKALEALGPDCVLIEGPPEADEIIPWAADAGMQPPVAMLAHCPDDSNLAVFYPLAEFSPEWQAIRFALARGTSVRFIDLPQVHNLALLKQREAEAEAQTQNPGPPAEAGAIDESDGPSHDPLGWLAEAAGDGDGESWWNHLVEERGDGEGLFAAIAEAMEEVRRQAPARSPAFAHREALREATMRQCIREARKQDFQRIAVVCGAWHVPALALDAPATPSAKADAQLLRGLAKVKVATTWVPWTYRHLASASGYGAGVSSPGWYEFLWRQSGESRAAGWLARVARVLREQDIDCSSAHVIEGIRLADTLAALRERPAPGLADAAPLGLIEERLSVGERLGSVPEAVPAVPLQRDIEQNQKTLRLKPEALERSLDLDLRKDMDLARSRLLHRLGLLEIHWGALARTGQSSRGTFHEVWTLRWEPAYAIDVITASRWGQTIAQAAAARAIQCARDASALGDLATLMDKVLLADLAAAVQPVTRELENRAAVTGDAAQLLATLPALANVFRYGSVRKTDSQLVAHLVDGIVLRATIGLTMACEALDEDAAATMRKLVLDGDRAIALRDAAEPTQAWRRALRQLAAGDSGVALLRGLAARLLLDAGELPAEEAQLLLSRNLSQGAVPAEAAAWLDGFLNRNAMVLLHDDTVWRLVDTWLAGLSEDHFLRVVPLVRRTFAAFAQTDRRDLAGKAKRKSGAAVPAAPVATWDDERAALPIPLLRTMLGVPE
jgi:hypothetical protein